MGLKSITIALALALIAAVSACGNSADPEPAPTPAAEPATPAPSTPPPAAAALATEEHDVGGVQVDLTEVRRAAGDTMNVRWRYTNTSGEDKLLAANVGSWYSPYLLAADTYLVDPEKQKKYLVITDSERRPVSSTTRHEYGEVTIAAGATINAWAKFPAPPEDVAQISVHVPGVIPFEEIPISE